MTKAFEPRIPAPWPMLHLEHRTAAVQALGWSPADAHWRCESSSVPGLRRKAGEPPRSSIASANHPDRNWLKDGCRRCALPCRQGTRTDGARCFPCPIPILFCPLPCSRCSHPAA